MTPVDVYTALARSVVDATVRIEISFDADFLKSVLTPKGLLKDVLTDGLIATDAAKDSMARALGSRAQLADASAENENEEYSHLNDLAALHRAIDTPPTQPSID